MGCEHLMRSSSKSGMILIFAFLVVCLILFAPNPVTKTEPLMFFEDFLITDFEDTSISNVSRWGTGFITLPYKPLTYVNTQNTPDWAFDVAVVGDFAYIADGASGMQIVNISDHQSLSIIGTYNTPDYARGICIADNFAYIATGTAGIFVVNVTNPVNPTLTGICDTPSSAWKVTVVDNYAYVADTGSGLQILNITNPATPTIIGNFPISSGIAYDVLVNEPNAFVAAGAKGLQIIDISDKTNPLLVGETVLSGSAEGLKIQGNYVGVALGESGFQLVDTSILSTPIPLGVCSTTFPTHDVVLNGQYCYAAGEEWGLIEIDWQDPNDPNETRNIDAIGLAFGIEIVGDFAYIAAERAGLQIIELTWVGEFEKYAVAQSKSVYTPPSLREVVNATLTVIDDAPFGTRIDYYLSADNGTNWESVVSGVEHTFTAPAGNLTWRAILQTSNPNITPALSSLTINYVSTLKAPNVPPQVGEEITNNNIPDLSWPAVPGAAGYVIEFDTSPYFNSANLFRVSVGTNNYIASSPFADATWYWRVATRDSFSDVGRFSIIRHFVIDTQPPRTPSLLTPGNFSWVETQSPTFTWENIPDAHTYILQISYDALFSSPFEYDNIQTPNYTLNTTLWEGYYYWRVAARDIATNLGAFSVPYYVLLDVSAPSIYTQDTLFEFDSDEPIRIYASANDIAGIDYWILNDTTFFTFNVQSETERDSDILILNRTTPLPGYYGLNITVYDIVGHAQSVEITIIVKTFWETGISIPGFPFEAIILGILVVLIPVISIRRRRERTCNSS